MGLGILVFFLILSWEAEWWSVSSNKDNNVFAYCQNGPLCQTPRDVWTKSCLNDFSRDGAGNMAVEYTYSNPSGVNWLDAPVPQLWRTTLKCTWFLWTTHGLCDRNTPTKQNPPFNWAPGTSFVSQVEGFIFIRSTKPKATLFQLKTQQKKKVT